MIILVSAVFCCGCHHGQLDCCCSEGERLGKALSVAAQCFSKESLLASSHLQSLDFLISIFTQGLTSLTSNNPLTPLQKKGRGALGQHADPVTHRFRLSPSGNSFTNTKGDRKTVHCLSSLLCIWYPSSYALHCK